MANTVVGDGVSASVMWRLSEIAARDGISKQAVQRQVVRLVEKHGLTIERDRQARVARVNVAEYDRLRDRHADLSKAQAPARPDTRVPEPSPRPKDPNDPVYTREQARNMAYTAELKRLEIEERLGRLVPVDTLVDDTAQAAAIMVPALERLPIRADELAEAVRKDGQAGARIWLKNAIHEVRNVIADELGRIVDDRKQAPPRLLSDFPASPQTDG